MKQPQWRRIQERFAPSPGYFPSPPHRLFSLFVRLMIEFFTEPQVDAFDKKVSPYQPDETYLVRFSATSLVLALKVACPRPGHLILLDKPWFVIRDSKNTHLWFVDLESVRPLLVYPRFLERRFLKPLTDTEPGTPGKIRLLFSDCDNRPTMHAGCRLITLKRLGCFPPIKKVSPITIREQLTGDS